MARTIRIKVAPVEMTAMLNDSRTAQAVWDALPITGRANLWGDEIYFSVPVDAAPENPEETVEIGDLAFWPPGTAFCIFFGPTPASRGDEVRPASPVNIFGRVGGDVKIFKRVKQGTEITIEKANED
jgi:hypothetical protein